MSKNIVFCADGTWNSPGAMDEAKQPTPSNVQKFYESLVGASVLDTSLCEQEISFPANGSKPVQVAKYLYGVGSDHNILAHYVGGALGIGLLARLVRGYTFISRNYEPGDRIYLLGFSRGAYTVRALAGLIARKGLLDWNKMGLTVSGDIKSYITGLHAWLEYQQTIPRNSDGNFDAFKTWLIKEWAGLGSWVTNLIDPVKPQYINNVPIEAIGVWETVGSLGIPDYNLENDKRLDLFKFADLVLSDRVGSGFHAVAIDEERIDFTPTLWEDRQKVEQVLFSGAHSDIGGGYSSQESGLSDITLLWMYQKMSDVGVKLAKNLASNPDAKGISHQPWLDPNYVKRGHEPRTFRSGLAISQSVEFRFEADLVPIQFPTTDSTYTTHYIKYVPLSLRSNYLQPDKKTFSSGVKIVVEVEPSKLFFCVS